MKIVQVENIFHPDAGYQINIISKYMVKFGHEVTIITANLDNINSDVVRFFGKDNIEERDALYEKKYGVNIVRLPVKRVISGRVQFGKEFIPTIKKENPDIVYIHENDSISGMRYLMYYKKLGYPLIMDSHMLEMASQNKFRKYYRFFYKLIFTPRIKKNYIKVIRTQDDSYVEKFLGIPLSQAPWISVGSDIMLFHPDDSKNKEFRVKNNISENAFVVLYAGKLDESKGGMLLAEAIEKKIHTNKEVVFVIVGKTVGEYGKRVEAKLTNSENRVIRFPTQKYEDLAPFYQAADLAVFPRQCSLSFYDVQACAVPVVFENNNINIDRAKFNNAVVFKHDDIDAFRNTMEQMINMPEKEYRVMKEAALQFVLENYNYEIITQKYCDLIEKEMIRQRGIKR